MDFVLLLVLRVCLCSFVFWEGHCEWLHLAVLVLQGAIELLYLSAIETQHLGGDTGLMD
jgi:hypothetical protein